MATKPVPIPKDKTRITLPDGCAIDVPIKHKTKLSAIQNKYLIDVKVMKERRQEDGAIVPEFYMTRELPKEKRKEFSDEVRATFGLETIYGLLG